MRALPCTIALVIMLALLAACSRDGDVMDDSVTHCLYDLVTYTGTDPATGMAQFELVHRGVQGSTMLSGNVVPPEGTKPLQRMMLRYSYDDNNAGAKWRSVRVYSMTNALTDSLRYSTAPLSHYAMHPVKMLSAWRTGDFINLHCQVEYTGKTRRMMLLIDDSTRALDTVHCYLHHDLLGETAYQWRDCYASFNVGNVWKRTECKTLRVHVNDDATGERNYDFDRL